MDEHIANKVETAIRKEEREMIKCYETVRIIEQTIPTRITTLLRLMLVYSPSVLGRPV